MVRKGFTTSAIFLAARLQCLNVGGVSGDVLWRRVRGRVVEASPGPVPGGLEGVRVEL